VLLSHLLQNLPNVRGRCSFRSRENPLLPYLGLSIHIGGFVSSPSLRFC
jgi:hypothetical protein